MGGTIWLRGQAVHPTALAATLHKGLVFNTGHQVPPTLGVLPFGGKTPVESILSAPGAQNVPNSAIRGDGTA